MRVPLPIRFGIAAAVGSLVLASCGSDSAAPAASTTAAASSTTTSAASTAASAAGPSSASSAAGTSAAAESSAAPAVPPTGPEIVIGNIGTYSGIPSTITPTGAILEAWVEEVNTNGGLGGRPVRLVLKDDNGNPTTAINSARQLVEEEGVVAIVGEMSLLDAAWSEYMATAPVPVIGGLPFNSPMATNPNFFPSGGNSYARIYGELEIAKGIGPNFGQLFCAEAPACQVDANLFAFFAPTVQQNVPVQQAVSASAPNYTAQCQALIDADVQSFQVGHTSEVAIRIMDACYAQGLRARQISTGGIATSEWLTHESAEGTIHVDQNFPFFDTSTPGTKAYTDLLTEYGLADLLVGSSGTYIYAGAELFEKAVEGVGEGEVTGESLKAALYAMQGETLDGIAPPLTFNQDGPTQINCWTTSEIRSGEWVAENPQDYQCAPDDLVAEAAASVR